MHGGSSAGRGVGSRACLWLILCVASACLATLLGARQAEAADITVTSNDDSGAGSLREAATTANGNGEADTISFHLPAGGRTIALASQIAFTAQQTTTIEGGGDVAVSGGDTTRVFFVNDGDLALEALTVREGRTGGLGGGILNEGGTLNVTDSVLSGNAAGSLGGGVFVGGGGTLTVAGSTLNNNAANEGGGIFSFGDALTVTRTRLEGNAASEGGGIFAASGTVDVTRSTVRSNSATRNGGGIFNRGGTMNLTRSTISANTANEGGGILNRNTRDGADRTVLENSTVSGNTARARGGGVFNADGLTTIRFTTITGNGAPAGEGGGVASSGENPATTDPRPRTEVSSSIVAANSSTDVDFVPGSTNSFVSGGYNLVGDGNATDRFGQAGDETGVADPGIGPLSDNGGPTQTHALLERSPAIDAVGVTACPPPATDQRDVARPQDGDGTATVACDIGAFEKEAPPPPTADLALEKDSTPGSSVTVGEELTYTITATSGGPDAAQNVALRDVLPAGVDFVSLSPASSCAYAPPARTVTCNPGDLADGDEFELEIVVRPTRPGPIENTATVSSDTADPDPANNSDKATVLATPLPPDNERPKARNDRVDTDQDRSVLVSVLSNDTDPDGDRLFVGSFSQPNNGRVVRAADGALRYYPARGFSGRDTFGYRACDDGEPPRCDTATVIVTVAAPSADLSIRADAPGRVVKGRNFVYTTNVTNDGPDSARNVTVATRLPGAVRFVRGPEGCRYNPANRTIVCDLGSMPDGAKRTRRLVLGATGTGVVKITSVVSSDTPDRSGTDNRSGR